MMPIAATETGDSRMIRLVVPLPPVSLRANSRAHWSRKKKDADEYSNAVYAASTDQCCDRTVHVAYGIPRMEQSLLPWAKARVRYVWKYAGVEPDHSNLGGHTKYLQDILAVAPKLSPKQAEKYHRWHLGLIENDRGITAEYDAVKVAHRRDECVEITITEVP